MMHQAAQSRCDSSSTCTLVFSITSKYDDVTSYASPLYLLLSLPSFDGSAKQPTAYSQIIVLYPYRAYSSVCDFLVEKKLRFVYKNIDLTSIILSLE